MIGTQPRRRRASGPYGAIAMIAGFAFALVAILHGPGIAYVIVAMAAALCYALAGMYCRRHVSAGEPPRRTRAQGIRSELTSAVTVPVPRLLGTEA